MPDGFEQRDACRGQNARERLVLAHAGWVWATGRLARASCPRKTCFGPCRMGLGNGTLVAGILPAKDLFWPMPDEFWAARRLSRAKCPRKTCFCPCRMSLGSATLGAGKMPAKDLFLPMPDGFGQRDVCRGHLARERLVFAQSAAAASDPSPDPGRQIIRKSGSRRIFQYTGLINSYGPAMFLVDHLVSSIETVSPDRLSRSSLQVITQGHHARPSHKIISRNHCSALTIAMPALAPILVAPASIIASAV